MPTLGEVSEDGLSPAAELAAAVRRLRAAADMSGVELARRVGTSQSTISRYESGRLAPGMLDAGRVGWALRAPAPERRRLIELARAVAEERAGIVPKRVLLQQGVAQLQRRIRFQERRATHIATFHPSIVPGLLQTDGYMRSVVAQRATTSGAERDAWVRERIARQHQMTQAGRSGLQIVSEAALHWGVPGAGVMADQCDHLARLAVEQPGWRVGVVPRVHQEGTAPLFVTNGFTLYDSATVFLGTTAGNALITDPRVVQDHLDLMARIELAAAFGVAAARIFTAVAEVYRADAARTAAQDI
jgi:transcriptional regulator with XRE-family HTH domain